MIEQVGTKLKYTEWFLEYKKYSDKWIFIAIDITEYIDIINNYKNKSLADKNNLDIICYIS